jgi:hypothetical protein
MMKIHGKALSIIGRPSKRERKELIQAPSATPLDTDIKAARATQARHKFLPVRCWNVTAASGCART